MNGPDYFKNWKLYEEGSPGVQQAIIKSPKASNVDGLQKLLTNGFHFSVLAAVDPNANNVVAAVTFHSSSSELPCLLRIETNAAASMCRLTVKSPSGPLTTYLKELLEQQLS